MIFQHKYGICFLSQYSQSLHSSFFMPSRIYSFSRFAVQKTFKRTWCVAFYETLTTINTLIFTTDTSGGVTNFVPENLHITVVDDAL